MTKPFPPRPQNLILDLGGVLFGIDPTRTRDALVSLAGREFPEAEMQYFMGLDFFKKFERGEISPAEFRQNLRALPGLQSATDEQLDKAWNALLLGPDPLAMSELERLARNYRLVLLSNTNLIHYNSLEKACMALFNRMERCFFSFRMGMRKPDPRIYTEVVQACGFDPLHTLMVDDHLPNLQGAEAAGLGSLHFTGPDAWKKI